MLKLGKNLDLRLSTDILEVVDIIMEWAKSGTGTLIVEPKVVDQVAHQQETMEAGAEE